LPPSPLTLEGGRIEGVPALKPYPPPRPETPRSCVRRVLASRRVGAVPAAAPSRLAGRSQNVHPAHAEKNRYPEGARGCPLKSGWEAQGGRPRCAKCVKGPFPHLNTHLSTR
jgi:hypothetical protein